MRRASRVDANHAAIVQALRDVGADVLDLSRVGGGCPDLLVGFRGTNHLIEVKTKRGVLNLLQLAFHMEWRGGAPTVVRTVDEALRAVGAI